MGLILGFSPIIGKNDFDTAFPSNFTNDDLDNLDYTAMPRPPDEPTENIIVLGKAMVRLKSIAPSRAERTLPLPDKRFRERST